MHPFFRFLVSMFKIGCIGFGGGSALIPVIEQEFIGPDKLDTKENYEKDILVANLTPGALPVELSGSLGLRNFGYKGMILGAIAMALPGILLTLLLLTCLSDLRARVGVLMEVLTVIVSIFIIVLILRYIRKVAKDCASFSKKFLRRAIVVMLGVFILSCGKNLYKLFGINGTPFISLSTFSIMLVSLLGIIAINIYRGWKKSAEKPAFRLSAGQGGLLLKKISSNVSVWIIFLLLLSVPAIIICIQTRNAQTASLTPVKDYLSFLWRGCLSVLMSFGGGDAYLAVADGLFIDSSIVNADVFYGDIVSVANILPGSILGKVLPAVGYYFGIAVTGSIIGGFAFALGGFAASIALSCGVFSIIYHLYDHLSDFQTMKTISHYIGPIISGLLGTVILALLVQVKNALIALLAII